MAHIDVNYQAGTVEGLNITRFDPEGGRSLSVVFTDEGIIMDVYDVDEEGNDYWADSWAMMYNEWADRITDR